MDLPETDKLMEQISKEDPLKYKVLDEATIQGIFELEKLIIDNQEDTGSIFSQIDKIQLLHGKMQLQTYLALIAQGKTKAESII